MNKNRTFIGWHTARMLKREPTFKEVTMVIQKIWKDGNEIFIRDDEGHVCQVDYGWWNGCRACGGLTDEIKELEKEKGVLAACKFALEHMSRGLCEECRETE